MAAGGGEGPLNWSPFDPRGVMHIIKGHIYVICSMVGRSIADVYSLRYTYIHKHGHACVCQCECCVCVVVSHTNPYFCVAILLQYSSNEQVGAPARDYACRLSELALCTDNTND